MNKIVILLISGLLIVSTTPNIFAGNYNLDSSSKLKFGVSSQELHVSVPPSLYDYYNGKTIIISGETDYSKLVTPDAVEPIAESLRNLTQSDEAFANAVLTIIHQIPYKDDGVKYPVETLVENSGKCDTLSLLAASIMKAGGLDVVLLCFTEVRHINVGVHLDNEPRTAWWWSKPTGYEFDGKIYWIAECTSATNWKVGEVPPFIAKEKPWIISLENNEKSSPARISSRLSNTLKSSSISINLSSDPSDYSYQERTLIISGSISPAYAKATVTLYFSNDGVSYNSMKTQTENLGRYSFVWSFNSTGTYYIRTNWSGNAECVGVDSKMLTVFVGFPYSPNQFEEFGYFCTYSRGDAIIQELLALQGVEDFLDIFFSGTGVLLTGEFIVLENGQIASRMQTETVTTPKRASLLASLVGQASFWMPEKTITVPADIPEDLQIVEIPENMKQKTNDQFSFILRKSGEGNCSFSVRGLDNNDMIELNKLDGNGTVLLNTANSVTENTWYKVQARISEDGITAELYDANGMLLESIANKDGAVKASQLVVLLADNKDRVVAFNNLNVEMLNQTNQPAGEAQGIAIGMLALTILLVITFLAAVYKRKYTTSQHQNIQQAPTSRNSKRSGNTLFNSYAIAIGSKRLSQEKLSKNGQHKVFCVKKSLQESFYQ
jgi:hypothetical protein